MKNKRNQEMLKMKKAGKRNRRASMRPVSAGSSIPPSGNRTLGHPISNVPSIPEPIDWQSYQPDPTHSSYPIFKELYSRKMAGCYNAQFTSIKRKYSGFVATCMVGGTGASTKTVCVLTKGVPDSLLPKTDYVGFMSYIAKKTTAEVVVPPVPWDSVIEIIGHRMEPTEYSPPRFRVRSFPSADEIAQLLKKVPKEFADAMARKGSTGACDGVSV